MINNTETVTEYNGEVTYWHNQTPTSVMLTNMENPDAFVWYNDEFLGTLKKATEHEGIFQCDGCKRYFFSFISTPRAKMKSSATSSAQTVSPPSRGLGLGIVIK